MIKYASYLILIPPLVASACSPYVSSSVQQVASTPHLVTKVSQRKVVAFQVQKEIIEWEQALELETRRIIDSGHDKLEEIVKLVSENTQELEQLARTAYIGQHLEYLKFGAKLAQEATRQHLDSELRELHQDYSEQIDEIIEEKYIESYDKDFNKRKYKLIEKHFHDISASQKNI